MAEIIFPKVHMNGTSACELIQQVEDAMEALDTAVAALIKMRPNGRDYYLTNNLREAEEQSQGWVDAVLKVKDEVEAMGEQIVNQM